MQINKEELMFFLHTRQIEMHDERSFVISKIDNLISNLGGKFKSKSEINQKRKEIIEIGKFIYCFNHDINIIDAYCESPDILISLNNKIIGVELTDLVIRISEKEKEGLLQKLFNLIEDELKTEAGNYNGVYNIVFNDSMNFNAKNQQKIQKEIKDIIKGKIISGNFVKMIHKSYSTSIDLCNVEAYISGPLTRNKVEDSIKKKEKKIAQYFSKQINEIWLLIVVGGINASDIYTEIADNVIRDPFKTNFTKIFIMNFFNSKITELKTIR